MKMTISPASEICGRVETEVKRTCMETECLTHAMRYEWSDHRGNMIAIEFEDDEELSQFIRDLNQGRAFGS